MKHIIYAFFLLISLGLTTNSFGQYEKFWTTADCEFLVKCINKLQEKEEKSPDLKSWLETIALPCMVYSLQDVCERNNIKITSVDDKAFKDLYPKVTGCLLNAINFSNNNQSTASNDENNLLIGKLLLSVMGSLFSKSENVSRNNYADNGISRNSTNNERINSNKACNYCNPNNKEGWYITDFKAVNRTYINSRYVKRPGYKRCEQCDGTGDCRVKCFNGKSDCPGWCDENNVCQRCYGDRFVICDRCKGSGFKN